MIKSVVISLVIAFAAAGPIRAADAPKAVRAKVVFDHPEKFKDIKDAELPTDAGEEAILDGIRAYVVAAANDVVPEGDTLLMTFTDIDLAGEYEPWRGPELRSVRIIESLYPPALKFSWKVVDGTGKTVREGSEDMIDVMFDMRITRDSSDPLRYEKAVLSDWMTSRLGDLKKQARSR